MRHSSATQLKGAKLADGATFTGYASVFGGRPDAYGDLIAPGAFRDSLATHKAEGTMPAMLWAHDIDQPIGRWDSIEEDDTGLKVSGRLTLDVPKAAEAAALLRDGGLTGLSIGYRVAEGGATVSRDGRLLTRIELFEVSLTAVPAKNTARVTEMKSIREYEEFLRDAGFPKAAAVKLAARGWAGLEGRDAAEAEAVSELVGLLRKRTAQIDSLLRNH